MNFCPVSVFRCDLVCFQHLNGRSMVCNAHWPLVDQSETTTCQKLVQPKFYTETGPPGLTLPSPEK